MSRSSHGIACTLTLTVAASVVMAGSGCYLVVDKSPSAPVPGDQCSACTGGGGPTPMSFGSGGYSGPFGTGFGGGGVGGQAGGPDAPLTPVVSPPTTCPLTSVARFNDLLIVDPQVTNDSRANNQMDYHPWSFRQRLEGLVPDSPDGAGALASAWLDQWSSLTSVPTSTDLAATTVSIQPRPAAEQTFLCPWLARSPDTGCDFSCTTCSSRRVDLTQAPFKLLAIANRVDVAATGTTAGAVACGAGGGELRFIYGAADPQTMDVLPFTVVFEYTLTLRPGETLRDWAAAWYALDKLSLGSQAYNAQLDTVVAQGLARATLARVRTNEVAFGAADGDPWEMRQFVPQLTDAGTTHLVEVAVTGTPRLTLASSPDLGQWIDANAAAVLAGQNLLPASMLAASAPIPTPDFSWHTTATDPATAAAFNQNTCNGCHGGRTDSTDVPFQHVAPPAAVSNYGGNPGAPQAAQLSHFLNNPGHADELGRRETVLAGLLCASCTAAPGTGGAGGYGGAAATTGGAGRGGTAGSGGAGGYSGTGGTGAGGIGGAPCCGTGGYASSSTGR
jgi:hypothetical protein